MLKKYILIKITNAFNVPKSKFLGCHNFKENIESQIIKEYVFLVQFLQKNTTAFKT